MQRTTAAFLALALAGASLGCGSRHAEESKQSAPLSPVALNWAARPGYVYAVALAGHAKLPSGNEAFALELHGDLSLELAEQQGDRVQLFARIDQPAMKLGGKQDPEADKIANELRDPVLVVLEGGRIRDTWFSPAASAVTVSTWRTILSAAQLSDGGVKPTWQAEEYDSTGRYRAEYTRNADGSVLRRKQSYLAVLDSQAGGPPGAVNAQSKPQKLEPVITTATTRFVLGGAELRTAAVEESMLTRLGDQSTLVVETKLTLSVRPNAVPPKQAFDRAAYAARAIHLAPDQIAPRPPIVSDAAFDELRMKGRKFADVVAEFEQTAKETAQKRQSQPQAALDPGAQDPEELREKTSAFESLTAFLRSDPEARKVALAKIRAKSPAAPMLVSGLSSAETAPAQQALLELVGDRKVPGQLRVRALMGLGRVQRPEPGLAAAISAVLGEAELHRQALFSLGSLSRRLRDAGRSAEVAAIRPELARGLTSAKTPEERSDALRAVSNSGDGELFPVVKPFLNDDVRVEERAAAAEALRHMNLPEVNRILAERLVAESSPDAALAILRAIRTRGAAPELLPAVTRTIQAGPSPNVRQRAIELARSWLPEHPELRAALAAAAEKDPDQHVRDAAAKSI